MTTPTAEIETVLRGTLGTNTGNLGRVYQLLQEGKSTNAEIIDAGAAANSGAASNLKTIINAILTGDCPSSPSLAAQAGRAIGGLLRTNPTLAASTQTYLTNLCADLDAHSQDTEAVQREYRQIEAATETLERAIENLDGVYVYTFPTQFRSVQKIDPERILLKVGKTDRFSSLRIREQQRATNMPEDPWTLRVYRSHELVGHGRADGRRAGREWFYTYLEFLDAVAPLLGLEVHKPDDLD